MSTRSHTLWLLAIVVIAAIFCLIPSVTAAKAAVLSINATPATLTVGDRVVIAGNLTDAATGAKIPFHKITVQVSQDTLSWQDTGSTIGRTGSYTFSLILRDPGTYYFRTLSSGNRMYAAATSPPAMVTVNPPAGPKATNLTIRAQPQTCSVGETVTISGKLAAIDGGAGIPGQMILLSSSPDGTTFSKLGTVFTAPNGTYSTAVLMTTPGKTSFRVAYEGNSTYSGSTSPVVVVDVTAPQQKATTLSLTASNTTFTLGKTLNLTGTLRETQGSKVIPNALVAIRYSRDGGAWGMLAQKVTNETGMYAFDHTPSVAGTYQYRATYQGDTLYASSESSPVSVTFSSLPPAPTTILSINATPSTLNAGEEVRISGNLTETSTGKLVPFQRITLQMSEDGASWKSVTSMLTKTGSYNISRIMKDPGTFYFRTFSSGNRFYAPATSPVVMVTVSSPAGPKATSLSILAAPHTLLQGESATVSGTLSAVQSGAGIPGQRIVLSSSPDGVSFTPVGTLFTAPNGTYSITLMMNTPGKISFRAAYEGNNTYSGSTSPVAAVDVTTPQQKATTLSLAALNTTLPLGKTLNLTGTLKESQGSKAIPDAFVTIQYSADGGAWSLLGQKITNSTGAYSLDHTPIAAGTYQYRALYAGSAMYTASESPAVSVTFSPLPPSSATNITLNALPTSLRIQQTLNLTGVLREVAGGKGIQDAPITIQYSRNGGKWIPLAIETTGVNGTYSDTHTPTMTGTYQYRALYGGNATFASCESPSVSVTVSSLAPASATTLTIKATPASPSRNESYTISGTLTDSSTGKGVIGKRIKVERSEDGTTWTTFGIVTTKTNGEYAITQAPSMGGAFFFRAGFTGDRSYQGSSSPVIQVIIKRFALLEMAASPQIVAPGGTVTCTGTLADEMSGAAIPGQTVKVMISQGNTTWNLFGTSTTGANGAWQLSGTIPAAGSYYLAGQFEGSSTYSEDWSNTVGITVT